VTRWTTRVRDGAAADWWAGSGPALSDVDAAIARRLRPRELVQRWERERWSADALDLGPDRLAWDAGLDGAPRDSLRTLLCMFVIGEYTATDLLAPIMLACPDEEDLLFLGTQVADEALHARFMQRVTEELLGWASDTNLALVSAWEACTPVHRRLSMLEGELVDELTRHPGDHGRWLRAVAVFHLVTEGMLALAGQRTVVSRLRRARLLPGVVAGFAAMARDESRHVSFGLHALRRGIAEGYADEICDVLERAAPLAVTIDALSDATPSRRRQARRTGETLLALVRARLGQLDLAPDLVEHVHGTARSALEAAIATPFAGDR